MTCMMNYEIATPRQVVPRNDTQEASTDTLLLSLRGTFPPVIARHDSAEAISVGEILNPKHKILNKRYGKVNSSHQNTNAQTV